MRETRQMGFFQQSAEKEIPPTDLRLAGFAILMKGLAK
jgi:hypothetical protein